MINRRWDTTNLLLVIGAVGVAAIAYFAANRTTDDATEVLALPDFRPPAIVFEVPFDLPFALVQFKRPATPKLELANGVESALLEVRSALLTTSTLVEVRSTPNLLAATD